MKALILIFSALFLTSCLDDLKLKNTSLESANKKKCENVALPNKCVFDERGELITDLGAETLKDDESKVYGAQCFNFSDNEEHCGGCGNRCKDGAECREGSCVRQCGKNERLDDAGECHCPGFEGRIYDTNEHCGECGNRCGADATCSKSGDRFRCLCSESLANLETSVEHCGDCRNNCNFTVNHVVDRICAAGQCDYSECEAGYIDLDKDRSNGCERELSELHIQYVTPEGVPVCVEPYKDCNGELSDGCEINTASDVNHCSACDKVCANDVLSAVELKCEAGRCDYGTCKPNFGDCDNNRANGCEINTASDVNHCSACGKACASSVLHADGIKCKGSQCDYGTCKGGFGDCDNNRANGCEINTTSDVNHCSACGKGCASSVLHADGIKCANSRCDYTTCKPNFGDCDGNRANGCETNLLNNITHCGSCGINCHTTVMRADGIRCDGLSCNYSSCHKRWRDRDGNRANGCEHRNKFGFWD